MDKSPEQQQYDFQTGREEGRRRAASGEQGPWSSDPDYARGLDEGRRDHEAVKQAGDMGGGIAALVIAAILFFARAVWHAVTNPGEALIHYGLFALAIDWIRQNAWDQTFIVIVASVGGSILSVVTFPSTLLMLREAEVHADQFLSRRHPALGRIFFYFLVAATVAAGLFIVTFNEQGGRVSLIVFDIPTIWAYAIVAAVAAGNRLFFHPLASRYNPLVSG